MNDTAHFKIFCLERYKSEHHMKGNEVYSLFKKYDVLDYINSFYNLLHTYGDKYIVQDIEKFIEALKS
jgi:hypothetical protein